MREMRGGDWQPISTPAPFASNKITRFRSQMSMSATAPYNACSSSQYLQNVSHFDG